MINQKSNHHVRDQLVHIPVDSVTLEGDLHLPNQAKEIVLFAHDSGKDRRSPGNRFVAQTLLNEAGLAALLIDLLTPQEESLDQQTRDLRFDVNLLSKRLIGATDWLRRNPKTHHLKIGYFGAGTGAVAALLAASHRPDTIHALVSRGGRPDMAGETLGQVQAPTLLIVGGYDALVVAINEAAIEKLQTEAALKIIPGATHLFEEAGALEQVAHLAQEWFQHYFGLSR